MKKKREKVASEKGVERSSEIKTVVSVVFEPELQHRLIPLFHYALKPAGFLLLGSAENIGRYSNLFDVVAPKSKLFRKRPGDRRSPLIGGFAVPGPPSPPSFIIAFEPTPTATPTAAPEASDEGLRLRIGQLEEELVEFREHVQFPAGVVGRSCASWG